MKHLILGDIHGGPSWKKHVKSVNPDKIVFVGDYFDSKEFTALEQMDNFRDIIALKKERPDDVTLLTGNHDAHYMGIGGMYSGFQAGAFLNIEALLEDNKDLMQWCHSIDDYLISHAGVTKDWCDIHKVDTKDIVKKINSLHISHFAFAGFQRHGDSTVSSPIWVRPRSLNINRIDDWKQIVGHTRQFSITLDNPNIILVDAIEKGEALILEQKPGRTIVEVSFVE